MHDFKLIKPNSHRGSCTKEMDETTHLCNDMAACH